MLISFMTIHSKDEDVASQEKKMRVFPVAMERKTPNGPKVLCNVVLRQSDRRM